MVFVAITLGFSVCGANGRGFILALPASLGAGKVRASFEGHPLKKQPVGL